MSVSENLITLLCVIYMYIRSVYVDDFEEIWNFEEIWSFEYVTWDMLIDVYVIYVNLFYKELSFSFFLRECVSHIMIWKG